MTVDQFEIEELATKLLLAEWWRVRAAVFQQQRFCAQIVEFKNYSYGILAMAQGLAVAQSLWFNHVDLNPFSERAEAFIDRSVEYFEKRA